MTRFNSTLLLLLISLLLPSVAAAAIIKGVLMDSVLNEGEPFATVRLFRGKPGDKALQTFLTDVDGNFSQQIAKPGNYTLVFSSLGKEDLVRELTVSDGKEIDLGTLFIRPNPEMMDEIVVMAQKPLVKMSADQMTYNVAEDTESKTQTLLDMLRKVPMVTVDGEDNITVNGSSSFQVYVDGKPSLLFSGNPSQMFKAMPASAVQSIEVVTNPGVRYDAEGTGGVLNLILDKQGGTAALDNAYNASVGLRAGNKGYSSNIYANAKTGHLTTSLNLIYNNARPGESTVSSLREQPEAAVETKSKGKPRMPFAMGNLSLEYELDSLSTIGASFALNNFSVKSPGMTFTSISGTDINLSYGSDAMQKNGRNGINGSIDFSHFFGHGRKNHLTVTYQIQHGRNNAKSTSDFDASQESTLDLTDRTSDNKERTTVHVLQADFSSHINEKNTISAGGKQTLRKAKSDARYYLDGTFDADGSMRYDNSNKIAAIYGEYTFTTDKTSVKGGLRYEYTWQDVKYHYGNGSDFKTDYGILVPSASLSYTISQSSNIGLNYNMRISRPGISYLNPYIDRSNPTALTYGNPDLDVEKGHIVGLVYNLFTSKFMMSLTLSDSYTGNGIEQYSFMSDNLLNTTYGNIVRRNRAGLNAYINWMPLPKTRIFLNGGVNYTDIRSRLDLANNGWQANAMLGLQQTLPIDIKAGAFLISSTKSYTLQGWNSGFQMLSINLSKAFLDNNLNVSLGAMTGLSGGGKMRIENYSANKNFTNYSRTSMPMGGFTVGVTYTFGNAKSISRKNRPTVSNDFIEHSSDMEQFSSPGAEEGSNF